MNEENLQLYETIELYLTNNLRGKALQDFEDKLQNDPDFKTEVELHRELNRVINDQPKREFRSKLERLRKKYDTSSLEEPPTPVRRSLSVRKWGLIAAGFFVVVMGIFQLKKTVGDPAFKETQALESQLGDTDPSDGMTFTIDPTFQDKSYSFVKNEPVSFALKGQLKTIPLEESDFFIIRIYNNKNELITTLHNNRTDTPIALDRRGEGEEGLAFGQEIVYPFQVQANLDLEPGLYYFTCTLPEEKTNLFVGKFWVK